MALRIDEYIFKGEEFVQHVARQMNQPNETDRASRVIVSLLHTLRDVLTPEESLHLIAQLPLYIKAAYVDGWKTSVHEERITAVEAFIERLREQDSGLAKEDFNSGIARANIEAVFTVLKKYLSVSEVKKIAEHLPPEFATLWNEPLSIKNK